MKLANTLHRSLIKVTAGKRGWNAYGMPVIKLTTIGRVSGQDRTVMLTSPISFDGDICLVASKGGDDRHPEWYMNLLKNPKVKIETQSENKTMFAHVLGDEHYAEVWEKITDKYPNYGTYQNKTQRKIPIIALKEVLGDS